MQELFENKTECSKKTYDTFLKTYSKEYSKSNAAFLLYNIIFFGFCMIFAFINKHVLLGFLLLIGVLLYLYFTIFVPIKHVEKKSKKIKAVKHLINVYKFYKYYFKIIAQDGESVQYYFKIYRVVETAEYFYIFLSKEYAFIVSKSGFTKGTSTEFAKFLMRKTLFKYKKRVKKY